MSELRKNEIEFKKSKFLSYIYNVTSTEEIDKIIETLRSEHKKAKHIVYAYKIGSNIYKTDAKEPRDTAGKPVLNVILNNDLDNTLIVVVRYFGGVLIGKSNLGRMYSKSANSLIKK